MPQFTIKRLMLVIAGIGVFLGLLQVHTFATMTTLYVSALAALAWFPARNRPRLAFWAFLLSATWMNTSLFVEFALMPVFHKAMLLLLASLAFVPIVPAFGLAWAGTRDGWARRARAALVVAALVAPALSMIATHWPFRLAFYLSLPALNRLADRVEAGGSVQPGEWAGLYRIAKAMPYHGGTALLIDPKRGDFSGFIRGAGASRGARSEWLDLDSGRGDRWTYLDED